ncbi:MAG TPA: fibronectin-binding domain-containing protein [Spirochaetales bacterium]|nr:fibronectin-binding domain-containing protein [Spirochaetales bacterium]
MSLNWRELALILEELPLEGSSLQSVVQHDFHSLSWHLYHPSHGRWTLYTEVGTPYSRMHMASHPIAVQQMGKTAKLQRFVQFCRANLEGARIVSVAQTPFDRMITLKADNHGRTLYLHFRFYSGPGANIFITDEDNTILDLLYRRPNRGEKSGAVFVPPEEKPDDGGKFPIRERGETSFNRQIEEEYGQASNSQTLEDLLLKIRRKRDREVQQIESSALSLERKMAESGKFEHFKKMGDLLSANIHLIEKHSTSIEVDDWESAERITIPLKETIRPSLQIQNYYERYQRLKGTFENARAEYEKVQLELQACVAKYARLLTSSGDEKSDIRLLKRELGSETADKVTKVRSPGLTIQSGQFTLLVGRNAKENDELLRRWVRGNDYWMHTRDTPGGYVFIKFKRDKSVPLDVLLDAANLALVFSKAKNQGKADLYYTQVKYLRRPKKGKTGEVIPTQEKNLSVTLDEGRLARLLSEDEDA